LGNNLDLLTLDDGITLTHDSDFDGWLTAVFVCYEQKYTDRATLVCRHQYAPQFFGTVMDVTTDPAKAERVLTKLTQTLAKMASDSSCGRTYPSLIISQTCCLVWSNTP